MTKGLESQLTLEGQHIIQKALRSFWQLATQDLREGRGRRGGEERMGGEGRGEGGRGGRGEGEGRTLRQSQRDREREYDLRLRLIYEIKM